MSWVGFEPMIPAFERPKTATLPLPYTNLRSSQNEYLHNSCNWKSSRETYPSSSESENEVSADGLHQRRVTLRKQRESVTSDPDTKLWATGLFVQGSPFLRPNTTNATDQLWEHHAVCSNIHFTSVSRNILSALDLLRIHLLIVTMSAHQGNEKMFTLDCGVMCSHFYLLLDNLFACPSSYKYWTTILLSWNSRDRYAASVRA
jgi:hypothetical protein